MKTTIDFFLLNLNLIIIRTATKTTSKTFVKMLIKFDATDKNGSILKRLMLLELFNKNGTIKINESLIALKTPREIKSGLTKFDGFFILPPQKIYFYISLSLEVLKGKINRIMTS